MKNAFVIVTFSAALSACALAPQAPDQSGAPELAAAVAPAAAPPSASPEPLAPPPLTPPVVGKGAGNEAENLVASQLANQDVASAEPSQADSGLPNVDLSSDLLFKLTRAELDFKRGQWQSAYVTLMAVAQQTRDPRIAQRASEMALSSKQAGEALAAIRLWRELAPDSDEASQYFLGLVVLGEQLDEAEPVFAKRLQQIPPEARGLAIFQMQQLLTHAKDKAAAFALLEHVLAPYGRLLETHLVLAQSAFANGDLPRAGQEARQALAQKSDSELAILTLAQVTPDAALVDNLLLTFLLEYPQAREVRTAYARLLVDQQQFEKARQQFLGLLKEQADSLPTLYALGVISMQLKDAASAQMYFKQFLTALENSSNEERDPSKVLTLLSQIAQERGDYDGAIAWLDKIDGSNPGAFFSATLGRAQLFAKRGDVDGARRILADIKTDDGAEQVHILMLDAQILRDAGYASSAFTVLENGLKRFPDNLELVYDFALAAEKVGKLDLMEQSLLQVIAQAPDNHNAYNALGYAFAERNIRLPEALALIEKALKMAPDDPFIMDSMAWVQFRMGHLEQAETLLRRAYSLRSDPEIGIHLGEVLWQKGEKAEAQKFWRDARSKDPASEALKNTLTRLNLSL